MIVLVIFVGLVGLAGAGLAGLVFLQLRAHLRWHEERREDAQRALAMRIHNGLNRAEA